MIGYWCSVSLCHCVSQWCDESALGARCFLREAQKDLSRCEGSVPASWALSSPLHGQHHIIIAERKAGACADHESQGLAGAALGSHLTLLPSACSSGPRLVF